MGNPKKKKKIVDNGYKFLTSFVFYVNVNKSTIRLHFFFYYIIYAYKISRRSKINNYIINQIFKFKFFVVLNYV